MSYNKKEILDEKLAYFDLARAATPGFVNQLVWWTEFKGAIRAILNMIQGAWRTVMAPIRGAWRISGLGYEKLKSVFTDKPPDYSIVMSRSRRAFIERSDAYREREGKAALHRKQATWSDYKPPVAGSTEKQLSKDELEKTGWTVRGATKKWVRSVGLPTIKESLVHIDYNLKFILYENDDSTSESASEINDSEQIIDAIKRDFQELKDSYTSAISPNATAVDIARALNTAGKELEDNDLDFYLLVSESDPDMPEEQKQWIGDETLKQLKSKILPSYFSQVEKSFKKSIKKMSRKYLSADESFNIENTLSGLSL
jgi:hypothetical protein